MFYLKEYNTYLSKIHFNEKIIFNDYKQTCNSEIEEIKMQYKVFSDIFEDKMSIGTQLFFYTYMDTLLTYKHNSKNNHLCFYLRISKSQIINYNIVYYNLLSYMYNTYKNYFFLQTKQHNDFILQFRTLTTFPYFYCFHEITSLNTLVSFQFLNNNTSYYINNIFNSHLWFNIK